ncbi:MAG: FAD-dependent oxidoreductase [Chitinispirillaceae bacterium]
MAQFDHLLSKGKIGSLETKNRVIMPPMGTVLAGPDGEITDHIIAYYSERAAGGVGLIITEIVCVENELGKAIVDELRADEDRFIPGFSRLAGSVQKYGTRIFAQLHHAGNQSNTALTGGKQLVAPSAVTNMAIGEKPRALSTSEVKDLVQKYINAAVRMQTAGFDGVELHGAHGYLICEFLSPHTNRRDDEYGGSLENRVRFASEIIEGIKTRCGKDFPVSVRFSADEFTDYGIKLDEGVKIARALQKAGADALDISAGTYESMETIIEPITYPEGWKTNLAAAVKDAVNIPVIAVGAIKRPATAEEILQQGKADFIAIGRGHLCDSEWVNKAAQGREDEITTCIACLYCIDTIFAANRIECAVNARTGRELEFPDFPRDGDGRSVAVIGAGPGGMETARVLALRGFKPKVYEKRDKPGGELIPGSHLPGKDPLSWYTDSLVSNLNKLGVEIRTGTEADPEMVRKENPSAVIVAIGAKALIPDIPGMDGSNAVSALDILDRPDLIHEGTSAIVIGGGMTGCETADMMGLKGVRVTLVEMLAELATGEDPTNRKVVIDSLEKNPNVEIITDHKLTAVNGQQVELRSSSDNVVRLSADTLVLSFGMTPKSEEVNRWREKFDNVHVIGDAVKPKNVAYAVRTAFDTAYTLKC